MAAVPLPSGYSPNSDAVSSDDHGGWAMVAGGVQLVFTLLFLGIRVWLRRQTRGGLFVDDWIILVSTVSALCCACLTFAAVRSGFGQREALLEADSVEYIEKVRQYNARSCLKMNASLTGTATIRKRPHISSRFVLGQDLSAMPGDAPRCRAKVCVVGESLYGLLSGHAGRGYLYGEQTSDGSELHDGRHGQADQFTRHRSHLVVMQHNRGDQCYEGAARW